MTIAERLPVRNKYKCDICGKVDFWDKNWGRYTSIAHDETCPNDVPCACSDKCWTALEKKIDSGEFALPVLRSDPGGFYVSEKQIGY
jgi:hypothetical protein